MLALEEIKVLDFHRNIPSMFCAMVLGELGLMSSLWSAP